VVPETTPKAEKLRLEKKPSPRLRFKHRDTNSMVIPIVAKHGGKALFCTDRPSFWGIVPITLSFK